MNSFVTVRVACAACGIVKGESNHWFCLVVQPEDEMAWTRYGVPILYAITSLNPDVPPRRANEFPVCGESCLNKLQSQLLSGKDLAA